MHIYGIDSTKEKVVAEGDAKVKKIQTLSHIKEISGSLYKVIIDNEIQVKNDDYGVTPTNIVTFFNEQKVQLCHSTKVFEVCLVSR